MRRQCVIFSYSEQVSLNCVIQHKAQQLCVTFRRGSWSASIYCYSILYTRPIEQLCRLRGWLTERAPTVLLGCVWYMNIQNSIVCC